MSVNIQARELNGPTSDISGISLGHSSSSGSDVAVRSPPQLSMAQGSLQHMGQGGDITNINLAMSSMTLSLETLGLDMSLEEAVNKLRDLSKENRDLRESVQQNNVVMKQQYQILSEWKNKWEAEREQMRQKHDQARNVVTNLRADVQKKDEEIKELQLELAQQDDKPASNISPSVNAELLTLEQSKKDLEEKCSQFGKQIKMLSEELQAMKNTRDEMCTENDKYIKIVREKEQKISQLERSNDMLIGEVDSLKKLKELNNKLDEEKKVLIAQNNQMNTELQWLRAKQGEDVIDEGVVDMSMPMQSGFVHIGDSATGVEVSDSMPFTDTDHPDHPEVTNKNVRSSATPIKSEKMSEVQQGTSGQKQQAMSDLLLQIQEERNKVSDLMQDCQHKNQELEALHRKVHSTEEMLAENEHKLNVKITQMKLEGQQREEELRNKLEQANRELRHSKSLSASRTSLDSQSHCSSTEEDAKALKIQVTSLVGELQDANDRYEATHALFEKQKTRIQTLEAKIESQHDDLEIQRAKDDDLIETLRITIANLEKQLTSERQSWKAKETATNRLSQEYGQVVQEYHELAKQNDMLKAQLQQQMQSSLALDQARNYEERIDNLTAQLITAEESMTELKEEKQKLQRQLDQMGGEIDLVAVLRAQAEVYKTDFEAERAAREKLHEEKEQIKEENSQLHLRNQQLQEELDHLSQNQIAEMQRRHGAQANSPYGGYGQRNVYGRMGQGEYVHPDGTGAGGIAEEPAPPQHGHSGGPQRMGDNRGMQGVPPEEQQEQQFVCPMCGEQSPDMDTLQLHVIECIN